MKNFICLLQNCLWIDLLLLSGQTNTDPLANTEFSFQEPGFLSTSNFKIPLEVSFTNVNEQAKYTFYFVNPVGAPEGSTYEITFPTSFTSPITVGKCEVKIAECGGQYLTLRTGASDYGCAVTDRTLAITNFNRIETQKRTQLYVSGVTNPNTVGALNGAFTILLKDSATFWSNANSNTTRSTLLAQNRIFPLITIKPAPATNGATSTYTVSNLVAGQLADYTFSISGISGISYAETKYLNFLLEFTGNTLSQYPELSRSFYLVESTNGADTLTYRAEKLSEKMLLVTGIEADPGWTSSNTPTFIIKNLRNPYQVQAAQAFTVKVLYQNNNYFLYSGSVTSANSYTANTPTAVQDVGFTLTNKGASDVIYTFRFNSPKELVATDSATIVVTFPAQFSTNLETTFTNQVGLHFDLTVTRANPASAGTTGNFGITIKINNVDFAAKTDISGVEISNVEIQTLTSPSVTALVNGNSFGVNGGIFEFQFTLPATLDFPPKTESNSPSIRLKFPYNVAPTTGLTKVTGTIKLNEQAPSDPAVVGKAKGDTIMISEGGFLSSYIWNQTVVKIELNSNLNNPLQQYSSSNFEISMFETDSLQIASGSGTFAVTFITSTLDPASASVSVEVPSSAIVTHMTLRFKIPFPIVTGSTIKLIAVDNADMTWDAHFGGSSNQQISCFFIRGLTGTCLATLVGNKEISISGYDSVTVYNQIVQILVPSIKNPTLSGSATATSAQFTLQVLNSGNKVLETTAVPGIQMHPQSKSQQSIGLESLTPNPAISRVATTTPAGTLTYAGLNRGFKIQLAFTLPGTGTESTLSHMKFGVPTELEFPQTALGCTAAYVDSENNEVPIQPSPFCQYGFDNLVTVTSFPFQELASQATVEYRLFLIEIQNPNSVFSPTSVTKYALNFYAQNWSLKYQSSNLLSYENMEVIESQLQNLKLGLSSSAFSDFLVQYTITFTMPQDVPSDSLVQIDFPSDFTTELRLIANSCEHNLFLNTAQVSGSTCNYSTRVFKFGSISAQSVKKDAEVQIEIKHLINPSSAPGNGITVKITNADGSVTYSNGASALTPSYTTAKTAGLVTVREVNAQYLNANNYANVNYELKFKVQNEIPVYFISETLIELVFPNTFNLGSTGTVYDCLVAYTPAVCTVAASTNSLDITEITSPISAGFIIDVQIPKVAANPAASGETAQSFTVTTKWGGTTIDTTSNEASATKSFTTQALGTLTIGGITIEPVNYNSRALYTFPVTSGSAEIASGAHLQLQFEQSNYGILVADPTHFRCKVIGLTGDVSCMQKEPASIMISNFDAIPASTSFSIEVYGIVKFQDSASSVLSYTLKAVKDFLVVSEGAQTVARSVFQTGPDFVELLSITADSYETQVTTDYTFQIKLESGIAATDEIGFIFPPHYYSFLTDQKFSCTSSQLTGSLVCVARADGHIYLSGFGALSGEQTISVKLAQILNPSMTGTVEGFMFKIQQIANKQLKYHSFPGSSQPNAVSFVSTLDPITLMTPTALYAGTVSSSFIFSLSSKVFEGFSSALTITSSDSSVEIGKITASATPISISNSNDSFSFSLSIAADLVLSDTFSYIYVNFVNTGNDVARFKPFTRSPPIRVHLSSAQQAPIIITNTGSIIKDTTSLPIYISLAAAPVIDITVAITSSVGAITASPASVVFNAVNQGSFTLTIPSSVTETSTTLSFAISGTNANSYKVPSSVSVPIAAADSSTISFQLNRVTIGYTSATVQLTPSAACKYYHEFKLTGLSSSVSDLEALSPGVSDGSSIELAITGLLAESTKTLFIIGIGQNGVAPSSVSQFAFTTLSKPDSYSFTISFTRSQSDQTEQTNAQTALFSALSTMTFITDQSFEFQSWNIEDTKAQITFFFVSDYFTSLNQVTPVQLRDQLSTTDGFNQLKSYYTGPIPLQSLISASVISRFMPEFGVTYPRVDQYYPDKIVLALEMNRAVTLSAVVIHINTGIAPNSNQVKSGLDGTGSNALASGSLQVQAANTRYELTLESDNLEPRTRYRVYLYAEDQSQPSIVRFDSVLLFTTRTRTAIYPPNLYEALDGANGLFPELWVSVICGIVLIYGALF